MDITLYHPRKNYYTGLYESVSYSFFKSLSVLVNPYAIDFTNFKNFIKHSRFSKNACDKICNKLNQ